ncbi:MAG: hypothetical protein ACE5EM_04735 [Sphingomonadales bacterium]
MTDRNSDFVIDYRRREMVEPAFERAVAAAEDIRSRYGDSVVAVLFYGSCLRLGDDQDKILDFYIIVDGYKTAYRRTSLAIWNKLLPPNVFYAETDAPGGIVRTKYAVLSAQDLARRTTAKSLEVTFWARFAQPVTLIYARDEQAREMVVSALANSVTTLVSTTAPLMPDEFSAREFWTVAFAQTYRAELRSESGQKPDELYRMFARRYDELTAAALRRAGYQVTERRSAGDEISFVLQARNDSPRTARRLWALRRLHGKMRSVLRLMKASLTFDGGIAYLVWKISRHSGVEITLTPWQQRHPVLTGLLLFWRLRRKGAFR